jgi:RNA polymerase sigma-B factor
MTAETRPGSSDDVAERFRTYQRTGDRTLRNSLIEEYRGLAHHLAKRYANRGEPFDDLLQVALLGTLKAVERFDPDRGVEFSTFAAATVNGELKRHFRDKTWAIHVPRGAQELHLRLAPLIERLGQDLSRPPTVAELATALDATEEAVLEAMEAGAAYRAASLDAPSLRRRSDSGGAFERFLASEDPAFEAADQRALVESLLEQLPERERSIMCAYFFGSATQTEIGAQLGISQMHVSRLMARSLARLRTLLKHAD